MVRSRVTSGPNVDLKQTVYEASGSLGNHD